MLHRLLFASFSVNSKLLRPFRSFSVLFGPFRSFLVLFGPFSVLFGPFWSFLVLFGPFRCLGLPYHVCHGWPSAGGKQLLINTPNVPQVMIKPRLKNIHCLCRDNKFGTVPPPNTIPSQLNKKVQPQKCVRSPPLYFPCTTRSLFLMTS